LTKTFGDEVRGMQVVGSSGRIFGVIEDLSIDESTWRGAALVVRVRSNAVSDLGLEKPFWSSARVEIPIHHVSATSDVVVLRTSLEEFAQLIALAHADDA
jgi:sporulation protein YlmC with PRC-barrel domain